MSALKRSLLNREWILINVLKASHFYVQSPCNSLIEDYTAIICMIDKGGLFRPFNVR
jgi:hypothetical protein